MNRDQFFWGILFSVLFCGVLGCNTKLEQVKENEQPTKVEKPKLGEKTPRPPDFSVRVGSAAFSSDGKLLIVAFRRAGGPGANFFIQRLIKLWDVETGQELHTFIPDDEPVEVFFFDGGKKILASDETSVTIFDVASRKKEAKYLRGGRPLAMFPDGKNLLVFTEDNGGALELWDPL